MASWGTLAVPKSPKKKLPTGLVQPSGGTRQADWDTPGYVPDYASLISGDYEYLAGLSGMHGADIADEAQLNETLGAAQRSYQSGVTDYNRQLQRGTAQGDVDLASRGTLASGALAVLRGALNEGYTRGVNQLGEQRANVERGARFSLAQNKAAREMQLAMLRAQVANRLSQDPRYAPQPGDTAKWNPMLNAYQTQGGNMYDQNRQLIGNTGPVDIDAVNRELARYYPGLTATRLAAPVTMKRNKQGIYR
jgi:hypothetical protein